MSTLFTHEASRVLSIGVGSLGCLAAKSRIENDDASSMMWAAAHLNSAELIATGAEKKLFLKCGVLLSAPGLARCLDENSAALDRLVYGCDAVVLCGELGDAPAPLLMNALSMALVERGVKVFALVLEPFSPNGEINLDALESCRERLERCAPFVAFLGAGLEGVSSGVSAKRIQKLAAARLAEAAQCFARALDNESASRLHALRGRHRAAFAAKDGTSAVPSVVQTALSGFDEMSRACLAAAVIQTSAELSFRDANAILRTVSQENANAQLVAVTRSVLGARAECLLLSGRRKSPNVIGIQTALAGSIL